MHGWAKWVAVAVVAYVGWRLWQARQTGQPVKWLPKGGGLKFGGGKLTNKPRNTQTGRAR